MLVPKLRFKREDGTDYPEWEQTCVGKVFDKVKDKNKDCSNTNVITNSAEFGLISQRDFFDKDIAVEGKTDNYTIIKTNDFVYNPRKSSFAPFGAFNGYTLADDGIVSPLYFCLRMKNNKMSANFMLWYFKSSRWHRFIYENGEQGGARHDRVGISEEMVKGIPIDKPCLEEQQKIAAFLSAVDEVIAQSEAEVQNLEQQKKAAMQKIFSQEVRFKREDGTEYPEWEEKAVIDVATLINGRAYKSEEFQKEGKYLILRVGNLFTNDTVYYSNLELEADKYIDEGDLIYAWSATFGARIYHGEKCIYHYHIWKVVPHSIDKTYLLYALNNDVQFISSELNGGTMHHLTKSEMEQRILSVPCLEEQQKIADFLSAYDEAISYAKQELDKWKELKKGLLQQMFV